jgi:hypothetical protein
MQEGREPFSKAVVASGGLVEQKLLRFARKISPTSHDGEAERVFEMFFVVDVHFNHPRHSHVRINCRDLGEFRLPH